MKEEKNYFSPHSYLHKTLYTLETFYESKPIFFALNFHLLCSIFLGYVYTQKIGQFISVTCG